MQLLGCSACLLGRFYAVAGVFWLIGVSMKLPGCSGCLLGEFYAVARVFWLFLRAVLCSC